MAGGQESSNRSQSENTNPQNGRTQVPSNRGGVLTIFRQTVTKIKDPPEGKAGDKLRYQVTDFKWPDMVTNNTKNRVKWEVKTGDTHEALTLTGLEVEIEIRNEWYGKEIIVMPYLFNASEQASVKTYCYILDHDILKNDAGLNRVAAGGTVTLDRGSDRTVCKALYEFKISWIIDGIDHAGQRVDLKDDIVVSGIKAFQFEYMKQNKNACSGQMDQKTIIEMNRALHDNWTSPSYLRKRRVSQNALRPDNPSGPCYLRALQAAAEEFAGKNLTLEEIQAAVIELHNKKAIDKDNNYEIKLHDVVIKDALERLGYYNTAVVVSSYYLTKLTVGESIHYTIREVRSGGHYQLGDSNGDLLWEPYDYGTQNNAYTGSFERVRTIKIIGNK